LGNLESFNNPSNNYSKKEDPLYFVKVDIDSSCEICGAAVEQIFLSKNKRVLTYVCPVEHVVSVEGNYQWLTRLLGHG
jgi:uncharacterized protein (UPF0212 family)